MLELKLIVGGTIDASYVGDILLNLGALSVVVTDRNAGTDAEQPLFQVPSSDDDQDYRPVFTRPQLWGDAIITACFDAGTSIENVSMALLSDFDLSSTAQLSVVNIAPVPDHVLRKDWVTHVHRNFSAVHIGDLCVRAPWHTEALGSSDAKFELIVEPGQAFGTGEHPTTKLVAKWLRSYSLRAFPGTKWNVLDYGCGSGILALAAVKFGAHLAVGCDIDAKAVETAVENAQLNACSDSVQFGSNEFEAQLFDGNGYDVVVANILAGPLKTLAPLLASRVAPGGVIALSGILASQAYDVSTAYSGNGLLMDDAVVDLGWALLVGTKPC